MTHGPDPAVATGGSGLPVARPGRDATLVGRDEVLAQLVDEMDRVSAGEFRAVFVVGSAGVGKCRVVAELLDRGGHGATVLSGRSYRWGATTSFGPWLEALDRYLGRHEPEEVKRLCGTALEDLATVLPSVGLVADRPAAASGRDRILDALAYLFARLAAERPVFVALDDFHLADASAWEALRFLGRRLSDAPIGIFATARPGPLRDRAAPREVLLGLGDDGLSTRVLVEPLRRQDVAALAHELLSADPRTTSSFVPDQLVTWLMNRSLGHPLFVTGLLRALVDEAADLTAPRLERVPETLRERVALDLEALGEGERDLLDTLAVVGRRSDLDALVEVSGRDLADLASDLEALTRRQLVVEHGDGADLRYEIAHPLIQEVVYEEIGAARRRVLHRTVARSLQAGGELGAAATHYARAGVRDDEAVDALFAAMARAEERGLYREALAVLDALLDVLEPGDERWIRVLDAVTLRSEWVLSHLAEADADVAVAAMRRVVEVLERSNDTRALASALFHLAAFQSFGQGRLVAAESSVARSIELFHDAADAEGELLATNERAWIRGCRGDLEGHTRLAREVFDRANEEGRQHPAIQAAGTAAYALGLRGQFDASRELMDTSRELAAETGNHYRVGWAYAQGCLLVSLSGELDDAIASGEAALEADASAPDALAYEDLAHAYWLAGRLHEATDTLERSTVRRPILGSRRRAWGAALAARIYGETGRRGTARSHLERATATYDGGFLTWSSWAGWTDGWLAWIDGEGHRAIDRLDEAAARMHRIGALAYEPLMLVDLVEVAADLGDHDRCDAAATRAVEVAHAVGAGLAVWLADLVLARIDLLRAAFDEAVEHATAAGNGLGTAGYELLAAAADEVVGRAVIDRDRGAAVGHLQRAAERFDVCGASWRRDRVVSLLAGLGARGRRAAGAVQGPASLTAREREVAELTAKSLTARDVGEKLFIGKRTVETHLANIYAKLGIDSKRELIRRAEEFGLGRSVPDSVSGTEGPRGDSP